MPLGSLCAGFTFLWVGEGPQGKLRMCGAKESLRGLAGCPGNP